MRPHAVIEAGPHTFTYDANGNMVGRNGAELTLIYDYENRPSSITKNGVSTTFQYDHSGQRVRKATGTTATLYIGGILELRQEFTDEIGK